MRLFGEILPFIGWREYDEDVIQWLADNYEGIDANRRYSGFQIAWLGILTGKGFKDIGPRETRIAL
jgi:hypothetical protein